MTGTTDDTEPGLSHAHADFAARLGDVLLATEQGEHSSVVGAEAAVLAPLFLDSGGRPHTVLTRRHSDLRRHPGEISFPGGRREPQDRSRLETALRESHEEIGLQSTSVEVVGALDPLPIVVTGYAIYPFVGLIESGRRWHPAAAEVDEVIELSLEYLAAVYERRKVRHHGVSFKTDAFPLPRSEDLIWGATGHILIGLLQRLGLRA